MSIYITNIPEELTPLKTKYHKFNHLKTLTTSLDKLITNCKSLEKLTKRERINLTSSRYQNTQKSTGVLNTSNSNSNLLSNSKEFLLGKIKIYEKVSDERIRVFSDKIKVVSSRYINKKYDHSKDHF